MLAKRTKRFPTSPDPPDHHHQLRPATLTSAMTSSDLATYQLQFQQVEVALTADPDNAELLKLKEDLSQVIQLTKDLISQQVEKGAGEEEKKEVSEGSWGVIKVSHKSQSFVLSGFLCSSVRILLVVRCCCGLYSPPVRLPDPREALAGGRALPSPVEQGWKLLRG